MTEEDARRCLRLLRDELPDSIDKVLANPLDVVEVDKVLRSHKLEPPKSRAEKFYLQGWSDAINAVADNLERKFRFRLTDDGKGWEYTNDQP